jgi:DNA-damage-inducible protein J
MAANALVQTRINGIVKDEAAAVLATMGLTVSDAVRLMLTRVAHDKALPFEPLVPNAETIAAMEEARRGTNIKSYKDFKALMADLDAED